jgi:hypothetical protein
MLVWYLILTPFIMLAWNIGLEDAGIVANEIGWLTAFGLAVCLTLIRGIVMAGRRPVVHNTTNR